MLYTGPYAWPNLGYPECNGTKQSPINIDTNNVKHSETLKPFMFRNYDVIRNLSLQVINSGHSGQCVMI